MVFFLYLKVHASGGGEWNFNGDSLWETSGSDFSFDVFTLFQSLFPSDDLGDTFDEDVDQFDFGLAQSVGVGDIPGATSGGRVNTSGTSCLETHTSEEVLEVLATRDQWDLDHGTSTETSTQVGWASEDPSQVVGVHEVVTFGLKQVWMVEVALANLSMILLTLSP